MKYSLCFCLAIFFATGAFAQSGLLSELDSSLPDETYPVAAFKSTRVINSQSSETLYKGSLDFRISHRFGKINSGAYNFFGLDQSTIRLALEYGITNRITIGLGRSSYQKIYDSFLKARLVQQKTGGRAFPFSATWFSNITSQTIERKSQLPDMDVVYRYAFAHQLILARRFSGVFSLQLAPIFIHRNLKQLNESNDTYAIEGGSKVSVSKRVSINADYIYRVKKPRMAEYTNSLSLGVDIETGGHVFQLHISNSQGMIEQLFVPRTTGQWNRGDIFYGFNISRQFKVAGKK
jgi:hypothetical protein